MSKPVKLVIALAFVGVLAYVVFSSFGLRKVSCEVCMEFKGRESCRTARGESRGEAIRTALSNACARITSGRTESILCNGSEPASIRCSE